jgi:hypothetical protein
MNQDGSASSDTTEPSQIAYLPVDNGTAAAVARRRALSQVAAPTATRLPPSASYAAPPTELSEDSMWWTDFAAYVQSKILGGALPPGCLVGFKEQRALSDLTKPL